MKNFKALSEKASSVMLILLPLVLFFSFYPIISLGSNDYMNFELSLPEIWLVLFFLVSLPTAKTIFKFYGIKKLALVGIFPLYLSLTILWSENRLRAILTAGLFWLVIYAALHLIYHLKNDQKGSLRTSLIKSLLISASVISAFCWLQCFLDVAGFSRDITLLCRGCVSTTFGFPHPSGFAIEPQFMGNLLIAPTLVSFYLLLKKRGSTILTLFLTATLFLTLSRGAIYAFVIAFAILLILVKKKFMLSRAIACVFVSIAVALISFGLFSAIGPTSDTFIDGTTKAIHQLTLGKIDLRPDEAKNQAHESTEFTTSASAEKPLEANTASSTVDTPHFSGYIEESTNTRLSLNSLALKTWSSSPRYILIGTGLGSAGLAMHQIFPEEIGTKEIVQNEYISLLLEAGILGLGVLLGVVIFTTLYLKKRKYLANNALFLSAIIGFALTFLFFSGLPNALHIFLFPLLFFNFNLSSKDNFLITNKVKHHRNRRR